MPWPVSSARCPKRRRSGIATVGPLVLSLKDYAFLMKQCAPDTVNTELVATSAAQHANHGLFQVTDRIYQVRGFDIYQHDDHRGRHAASSSSTPLIIHGYGARRARALSRASAATSLSPP